MFWNSGFWLCSAILSIAVLMSSMSAALAQGRPTRSQGAEPTSVCTLQDRLSCVCIVDSLADDTTERHTLRRCITGFGPESVKRVIRFAVGGEIQLRTPIEVPSSTVIDGRSRPQGQPPVTVTASGRMFILRNTHSTEISGLRFHLAGQGKTSCDTPQRPSDVKGCGVAILALGAQDVWIHNNEFFACGNGCVVLWTDRLADGRVAGPDRVTISRNIIRDSYYGVFAGAGNFVERGELPGHMRVAVHENIFDRVFRRSPKISSGVQMYLYNNLITNWGRKGVRCSGPQEGTAASSTGGAQLLAEANVFSPYAEPNACRVALQAAEKSPAEGVRREMGMIRAKGNLLLNGALVENNDAGRVFNLSKEDLSFFSPHRLLPADEVERHVRTVAGPSGDER